jgi:hypothetical protein
MAMVKEVVAAAAAAVVVVVGVSLLYSRFAGLVYYK